VPNELAWESISGAVLHLYMWLTSPEEAGTYTLASICICTLMTGYTSATIAYDMDIDVAYNKTQPNFYGYIPDDIGARGRCFILMTMISTLHNMTRSLGYALLIALSSGKSLAALFIGGEQILFLIYKMLRGDFFHGTRAEGSLAVIASVFARIVSKTIVDFR